MRSSGFISNLRPTRVRSQFVDNIAVGDFPRILATAFSYNAVINILGRLISNRPLQKTGVTNVVNKSYYRRHLSTKWV